MTDYTRGEAGSAGADAADTGDATTAAKGAGAGVAVILAGVGVFMLCSLIQGWCGSSMFSTRYSSSVGLLKVILINITFFPGWIASVFLVGLGVLAVMAGLAKPSRG